MNKPISLSFTGERVLEGNTPKRIWLDHICRYEFAKHLVKGRNVLDVSCGTGYGSRMLCDGGAEKVIGLDISQQTIDYANRKYKTNALEFSVGNILNMDFPTNAFYAITSFETIEHVDSQEKAFKELQRVLKPKGFLIISSPNRRLTSPGKSINDPPDNSFHHKEYSTAEFINIVGKYFEIIDIYGQRAIHKVLLLPLIEDILRRVLPELYSPEQGKPELEIVSFIKEYRYNTIVCKGKSDIRENLNSNPGPF